MPLPSVNNTEISLPQWMEFQESKRPVTDLKVFDTEGNIHTIDLIVPNTMVAPRIRTFLEYTELVKIALEKPQLLVEQ